MMKKEIQNPFLDKNCFFCGEDSKIGLKLKFYWDETKKETYTEYKPTQDFVGQGNILHGAIQMGLLDEIMGWTSFSYTQEMGVTSDITIKFLSPVYILEKKVYVTCRVISKEGPIVKMEAILSNNEGVVCTSATGAYHILSPDKYNALVQGK